MNAHERAIERHRAYVNAKVNRISASVGGHFRVHNAEIKRLAGLNANLAPTAIDIYHNRIVPQFLPSAEALEDRVDDWAVFFAAEDVALQDKDVKLEPAKQKNDDNAIRADLQAIDVQALFEYVVKAPDSTRVDDAEALWAKIANQVRTIIRTQIWNQLRESLLAIYDANDAIQAWEHVANIHSGYPCIACTLLSAEIFAKGKDFPGHPNDVCYPLALLDKNMALTRDGRDFLLAQSKAHQQKIVRNESILNLIRGRRIKASDTYEIKGGRLWLIPFKDLEKKG